jgi:2,4-dienoyl-CoA reductase-like NADH-dependent reductase (Old Yellow Enzyme family)
MSTIAPTAKSVESLFRPFKFGRVTLKNRVAMAPMTRSKSPGNVPGADVAAYYRRRAEGGVGLIITEGTPPCPAGHSYPDVPAFYGEQALAGWRRVAEEVHAAGGYIIPQLWHVGSFRQPGMEPDPSIPGYGPSAILHPALAGQEGMKPPVAMTQEDIDDTVAAFATAARNAKRLGFDGVELHGAHSYVIDQFFWSATNQRTDQYGGTLPQRTRFAVEIIRAVRAAIGPDFPLLLRFSQWKQGDYRHKMAQTPGELAAFLEPLADAGVDIFHCSTRRFDDPEFEGSTLNLAGWTKKLTSKPTMTVGSVGLDNDFLRTYAGKDTAKANIDALLMRLENDEFDLVAVGRALLADAAWTEKIRRGQEDQIVAFQREHMAVLT